MSDVNVLIVAAGPVALALAIDVARCRGQTSA